MFETVVVGGVIGEPHQVVVPPRSMARIQRAALDAEGAGINVVVLFSSVRSPSDVVVSEVRVTRGSDAVQILYRNGRFWKASTETDGAVIASETLRGALARVVELCGASSP